jgi:hypothetical protein
MTCTRPIALCRRGFSSGRGRSSGQSASRSGTTQLPHLPAKGSSGAFARPTRTAGRERVHSCVTTQLHLVVWPRRVATACSPAANSASWQSCGPSPQHRRVPRRPERKSTRPVTGAAALRPARGAVSGRYRLAGARCSHGLSLWRRSRPPRRAQ